MTRNNLYLKTMAIVAVVGLLAACAGDHPGCAPPCRGACTLEPSKSAGVTTTTSAINVYFDISGSMGGYLQVKPGEKSPYVDISQSLPHLLQPIASTITYHNFGSTIQALPADKVDSIIKPDTYKCRGRKGTAACNNQESRIDAVLDLAHQAPIDTLFVVVTDLFLSNAEVRGPRADELRRALAQLLQDGRSLAIIGVQSPFSGVIYDLPSGSSYSHNGVRPLYVLAIGQLATLNQLLQSLDTEILSSLPKEAHYATFFTNTASTPGPQAHYSVIPGNGTGPEPQLARDLRNIPQFHVSAASKDVLKINIPAASIQSPYAVPLGNFVITPQVWMWVANSASLACAKGWISIKNPPPMFDVETQSHGITLSIGHKPNSLRGLPLQRVYAASVELQATALDVRAPSLQWLHSWSFASQDEARIRKERPKLFPTLNLAEFGRILAGIASDRFQPHTVATYTFIFRLDN